MRAPRPKPRSRPCSKTKAVEPALLPDRSRPASLAPKPKPRSRPRFQIVCFQGHPRTVSRGDTYLRKLVTTPPPGKSEKAGSGLSSDLVQSDQARSWQTKGPLLDRPQVRLSAIQLKRRQFGRFWTNARSSAASGCCNGRLCASLGCPAPDLTSFPRLFPGPQQLLRKHDRRAALTPYAQVADLAVNTAASGNNAAATAVPGRPELLDSSALAPPGHGSEQSSGDVLNWNNVNVRFPGKAAYLSKDLSIVFLRACARVHTLANLFARLRARAFRWFCVCVSFYQCACVGFLTAVCL